ncbi:hypothetical protein EX895_001885 [Sporisorium graminicola]|uniref:Uncharacterized protein n=1 Tax=Sporisorium graminicola TaxID=280036 RepID=A0A4U7KX40_9BASI|nr:hypothetical protein EX895_001885 [Sporisorium graminicola]TKY89354.1 hypothetical protein EX895_001885 [Sporisorium graminicola]
MGKPDPESTITLLSMIWPPAKDGDLFGPDCPFTVDSFLELEAQKLNTAFDSVPQMKGALRLVQHLHKHNVPICIATTSTRKSFEKKTAPHPELFGLFGDRIICGDDIRLARGKPAPDIFLLAAREGLFADASYEAATKRLLGNHWVEGFRDLGPSMDGPQHWRGGETNVVVLEDGKPGVHAAKAAGMHVVWVPDPNVQALFPNNEIGASQTISSLLDFDPASWGLPPFEDAE